MMRKIATVLLITMMPNYAMGDDCDFSTGIEKLADGRYAYSVPCHLAVGKMVQDLRDRQDQVNKLNQAIALKDLALQAQETRANMWMDTSTKLEDRVNTIDRMNSTSQFLYFGLGILAAIGTTYAASKLIK